MTEAGEFDELGACFACGGPMRPVGEFRYLDDQAGFVPDAWMAWCRELATLVRCERCGSQGPLRRPTEELLAAWYRRQNYAAGELVSAGHLRAAARLRAADVGVLVDVGTGAGSFLDRIDPAIRAFGLEPSVESAEAGRRRGRQVLQPDGAGWSDQLPDTVDAITLFDVAEHLRQPAASLVGLIPRLRPGGRLMIFTGDAGSAWARLWSTRWWYHGYAGHLSCFSAAGLTSLLRELKLEVELVETLIYADAPQSIRATARAVWLEALARLGVLRSIDARLPPYAASPFGIDHMLVTARVPLEPRETTTPAELSRGAPRAY